MQCKVVIVRKIRSWYMYFAVGVFMTVAMLSGNLQPLLISTQLAPIPPPVFQGNAAKPQIALACNVFWGEEYLPDMLKTLAENNIHITFFIGGSWGKKYPEILKDLASRGHELGNHSYSHPHPNNLSKEKNKEQIIKTEELVADVTGIKTNLYAPPYGEYNNTVLLAAQELEYTTIMWSIDTIDWKRPPPDVIKERVLKKLHNGAIILMHPTAPTAQALPGLITEIQKRGYTITTVSDILQ
ncbi:polysaccharide deacetylase family protein [Sporomusa acidovorans]|uniref:Peptidoglycan-N-acetylglucosamine deacetylase n=1 Tax=Sporomusa acidovorans (strain ATCC 49682 / DSM 3132 / Mol) TaxID=1123286 RepID=A0ABZ3J3A9_SPOA4|nr:polysaccharide deacetylase family protein [Sporomusa acidovorans]OZC20118.1 peptidoglycan-N-acetylglucosamine deacetylase [Sporomusa acidovorans DSM 3132]SDD44588.1 probable sporulation protein, polysaccharide deacetylase family [Sporomusa acidovorans]